MSQQDLSQEGHRYRRIQWIIDAIWGILRGGLDFVTLVFIRLYGIEDCTLKNVREGRYESEIYKPYDLNNAIALDDILAESKVALKTAADRRTTITDKCKTLLTLDSLLLAIVGALLPKSFEFNSRWMRVACFCAIIFLLGTIVLLLVYFAIGREQLVSIEQGDINLDAINFKKSLINGYRSCFISTNSRTDYLVDIYRVARSFFILAFIIIIFLFGISYFFSAPDDAERLSKELRANPNLIELLRGPKGDTGNKGDKGDKGDASGKIEPKILPFWRH